MATNVLGLKTYSRAVHLRSYEVYASSRQNTQINGFQKLKNITLLIF